MDVCYKSGREEQFRQRKENPSFSSSLLDAIYNSIDERDCQREEAALIFYREAMKNRQISGLRKDEEMAKSRKTCTIDKWMEKKAADKVSVRRNSLADFERKARNVRERDFKWMKSSSSSSESSSGGGFSSSESESILTTQKLKPIRTTTSVRPEKPNLGEANSSVPIQKIDKGTFVKTKSKALKIYGDLKKVRQPISPGGRLATFLNSIFNGGSPKKPKISSSSPVTHENYTRKPNPSQESTCSSASSFTRSCLSKTPSSTGKLSNTVSGGTKRTVRFCPVSVIVDEDSRACGHKSIREGEPAPLTRRHFLSEAVNNNEKFSDSEEDDVISCSSSDLFELDNLSAIGGGGRYSQELPVYETTRMGSNRVMGKGFIL